MPSPDAHSLGDRDPVTPDPPSLLAPPSAIHQVAQLEVQNAAWAARVAHLEAENQRLRQLAQADSALGSADPADSVLAADAPLAVLMGTYLAQISMPAWVCSADGVIVYANEAYEALLMGPHQSALGRAIDELYPPEYASEYRRHNDQVLATGAELESIEAVPLVDGTVATYLVRKCLLELPGDWRYIGSIAVNITDLKRTEATLQESVARWQLAMKSAADGIWDWNLATDCLVSSPPYKSLLGYGDPGPDSTSAEWQNLIHPDDRPQCKAILEPHLRGETEIYQHEYRMRCQDGSYKWLIDRGKVIEWGPEGQPRRMIGTFSDISAYKQIEHQLRDSEATNRAILSAMPDLLLRVGRNGICYDCILPKDNRAGQFLPIRHNVQEVLPPDLFATYTQRLDRALATGEIQVWEQALMKNGQLCHEEVRMAPCGQDECLVVVRDITERKTAELALRQSEARFMAISDASPANIYILVQRSDGSIYFEHMSRSVEVIHEVSLEAVLANANVLIDHTHPDDRAAYDAAVEHSGTTLEPFSHQWRIITPSGRVKWLEGRSQPCRRPNGDTAWYGVVIDITELKRIEADRQQTALELQQSLDQLIATQAALQTSETQLSGILNSSLNGVIALRARRDSAGTIVDFEGVLVNPAACKLLHRPAAKLVGGSMLQVLPGNRDCGLFDQYIQVVETGHPLQRELYYDYDQMEGWYEVVAVKQGDGIAVTFHDITGIKQSELALQRLNQQLEQQVALLHQRNTDMQLLGSLSNALQACQTTEEAYGMLADLLQPMFPQCGGGLLAMPPAPDNPSPSLEVAVHWGATPHPALSFTPSACLALQQGSSLQIDPEQVHQRCCHLSYLGADQTTFCVPLTGQGTLLGLFYLHSADPDALNPAKGQLAQTVADQMALALANLSLREMLRHQSIRDPLTELYNRRYLEESLTQEIVVAQRQGYSIGVVMLDLDHFKLFNDTYGHAAGDCALQNVAKLLQDQVRGSDIACRYGGEEITLILPGSGLDETRAKAEDLRQAIADLTWPAQPTTVTASLGVACFPQHGETLDALLQAADEALYRAKQGGRDRVVAA